MEKLQEKILAIKKGELTAEENISHFLAKIDKEDKKIGAFLYVNQAALDDAKLVDKKIKSGKAGKLAGLAIAVKSLISVQGLPATCASKTLENYKASFDADVITAIKKEDGIIIGMTNMDEFACGASGENSGFFPTQNPAAMGRIPGGSSSGSAAAVAADFCDLALGSDTGGSIRNPASHCGIVGVKPSYGRVSRYGLIDMSMSLEGIGPFSKEVFGTALLLEIIAGHSRHDATTYYQKVPAYSKKISKCGKLKIGVCEAFNNLCTDQRIPQLINSATAKVAEATGSSIVPIELANIDLAVQAYYPIVYVEFFSGTRKFDGRKYGKKIEENCGEEVLRRILGGREISKSELHGMYYRKALAAQKVIRNSINEAFKTVDVIMLPTTPILPHKLGTKIDARAMYAYDVFTGPANLAGNCAGVVNAGMIDGCPVGLQIYAPAFKEELLLSVMAAAERILR